MMFRYIIYAIIIYLVYLAVKWAFRIGKSYGARKKINRKENIRDRFRNVEEAEYTEVKKDNGKSD